MVTIEGAMDKRAMPGLALLSTVEHRQPFLREKKRGPSRV